MLKKASLWMLCMVALASCTKDPLTGLSDTDSQVFITNRDKSIDFKQYKTFNIVDSVTVIQDNRSGKAITSLDKDMLIRIVSNMEKLGYKYVNSNAKPDIGVGLSRITNTSLNVVSNPYWGGGYGYGYGYGYPSYYSYYETSESYWYLSMADLKNRDTTKNQVNIVWDGQIRGGALGTEAYVDQMVDAVFNQSSYLKNN